MLFYILHSLLYIRVIILADFSHGNQGTGVLVGFVWVQVMEGVWFGGVSIAGSEVYPHSEVDLTSSHNKVQEGIELRDLNQKMEDGDKEGTNGK